MQLLKCPHCEGVMIPESDSVGLDDCCICPQCGMSTPYESLLHPQRRSDDKAGRLFRLLFDVREQCRQGGKPDADIINKISKACHIPQPLVCLLLNALLADNAETDKNFPSPYFVRYEADEISLTEFWEMQSRAIRRQPPMEDAPRLSPGMPVAKERLYLKEIEDLKAQNAECRLRIHGYREALEKQREALDALHDRLMFLEEQMNRK